ncbi:MAG: hypothetical protein P0Y59_15085 [Candidatus Sphingomonas phytovorans]|nr:hypothetical protein [Sphingomonas sp.]WEJ98267.1 MAG: hypothetical protein P0Y59_15085 [Sphingomonas sp.]
MNIRILSTAVAGAALAIALPATAQQVPPSSPPTTNAPTADPMSQPPAPEATTPAPAPDSTTTTAPADSSATTASTPTDEPADTGKKKKRRN